MSKKHFIAMAQYIMQHNNFESDKFTTGQLGSLARFCKSINAHFNGDRWLAYIAGECGPNGGAIKPVKGVR